MFLAFDLPHKIGVFYSWDTMTKYKQLTIIQKGNLIFEGKKFYGT